MEEAGEWAVAGGCVHISSAFLTVLLFGNLEPKQTFSALNGVYQVCGLNDEMLIHPPKKPNAIKTSFLQEFPRRTLVFYRP